MYQLSVRKVRICICSTVGSAVREERENEWTTVQVLLLLLLLLLLLRISPLISSVTGMCDVVMNERYDSNFKVSQRQQRSAERREGSNSDSGSVCECRRTHTYSAAVWEV